MGRTFKHKHVVSGTHGQVVWDGDYVYEITSGKATVKTDRTDIQFCGDMTKGSKLIGIGGEFSIKVMFVYDRGKQLAEEFNKGNDPLSVITMSLKDPDALGNTSITLYDCWFNDLPLIDFESNKVVELEFSGGFSSFKYNSSIDFTKNN